MRRSIQVLASAMFVVMMSATVRADIIAQHVGSADPTTEGFLQDLGTAGSAIDGGGTAAWEIDSGRTRYVKDIASVADSLASSQWEMSATIRDTVIPFDPAQLGIYMELSHGINENARTYAFTIGSAAANAEVKCAVTDFVGNVIPIMNVGVYGDVYHTYRIVRDNPASTDVKVYVDGIYEATVGASTGNTTISGLNRFVWGATGDSTASNATGRWSAASLTTPVPEPSTIALMVTGVLGLVAYAWRKRR